MVQGGTRCFTGNRLVLFQTGETRLSWEWLAAWEWLALSFKTLGISQERFSLENNPWKLFHLKQKKLWPLGKGGSVFFLTISLIISQGDPVITKSQLPWSDQVPFLGAQSRKPQFSYSVYKVSAWLALSPKSHRNSASVVHTLDGADDWRETWMFRWKISPENFGQEAPSLSTLLTCPNAWPWDTVVSKTQTLPSPT